MTDRLSKAQLAAMTPEQRELWNATNERKARLPSEPQPAPDFAFARGDEVELGQHLARKLSPNGDVVQSEDRVWSFNGSTWTRWDDSPLKRQAQDYAGKMVLVRRDGRDDTFRPILLSAGNVRGIVANCKDFLQDATFFTTAPIGIPFAKTFARVDGKQVIVEPLTRDHRVKEEHASPFDLDTSGRRPAVTDALLATAWSNQPDAEARILFFWEWLGAALAGIATRYKDTPILFGPKDTGKSQILHAVTCCFPTSSHRAVTLQNMSSEYHRAYLSGGRINSVNELPARELLDGEAAKAILSGDVVNCRRPRENPFDWVPRCAHIFSTNGLPPSRDDALMDRFTLLDCTNVMPDDAKDRDLAEKITAEAPLIAAAALAALPALLERGRLIRPGSAASLTHDWRQQSDPIHAWAFEFLGQPEFEHHRIPMSEVYAAMRQHAADNGYSAPSMMKFSLRLKSLAYDIFRSDGMKIRAQWQGPARAEATTRWKSNETWHGRD